VCGEECRLGWEDFSLRVSAGSRALAVPLPLERFRALGTLLPLLAGNDGEAEIAASLEESLDWDEQQWARDLLAKLSAQGFLQRGPVRPNYFLRPLAVPRVTFVVHTSLLLH